MERPVGLEPPTTQPDPEERSVRKSPTATTPKPSASAPSQARPDVSVTAEGFLTWALLDRATGRIQSDGDAVNTTESMIKPWVVADYFRRLAEAGQEPTDQELEHAKRAIRDSDNAGAQILYEAGGSDDVVQRMIDMCGLTDTEIFPDWWSRTEITAPDAVRMGKCLADGTAAGPQWTEWVLEQMRQVRGTTDPEDQRAEEGFEGGRWGIIDGVPTGIRDSLAIKNGWTRIGATDSWHLNCLAVSGEWVLAVLIRYPAEYSLDYGAQRCAEVARQALDPYQQRQDTG